MTEINPNREDINLKKRLHRKHRHELGLCGECSNSVINKQDYYCLSCKEKRKVYRKSYKNHLQSYNKIYKKVNKIRLLFLNARHRAKIKNIQFSLTIDDIPKIKEGDICPCFAVPFNFDGSCNGTEYSPSLDRIDPAKGYLKDNIQIICNRANIIKGDGTLEEHIKILNFLETQENLCYQYTDDILWQTKVKKLLTDAKRRALKKQIIFDISKDYIENIMLKRIPMFCLIFGTPLKINNSKHRSDSISIDRIDPNKGYTETNIQLISLKANALKNDATIEERRLLIDFIRNTRED